MARWRHPKKPSDAELVCLATGASCAAQSAGFIVLEDGRAYAAANWAADATLRAISREVSDGDLRQWLLAQQSEQVGLGMTSVDLREIAPYPLGLLCCRVAATRKYQRPHIRHDRMLVSRVERARLRPDHPDLYGRRSTWARSRGRAERVLFVIAVKCLPGISLKSASPMTSCGPW